MINPEPTPLRILDRLYREHPAALQRLLDVLETPPNHGRIELQFRHGKLHGLTVSDQTLRANET